MGRIARAVVMGIVRRILVSVAVFVYVVTIVFGLFFLALARLADRPDASPSALILAIGLGTFLLLVLPAFLAAVATSRRNARFDRAFGAFGLAGFPFALQYRRYDGRFAGRRLQAFVSRGPRLVLEAGCAVATRFGISANAEDTRLLARLLREAPLRFAVPAFDGLVVFGKEEAWVRRLLAEPGVPALLERLLKFDGPFARRQLELRPGTLRLTLQLSTELFSWIPSPEAAHDWVDALAELAAVAERVPPPAVALEPTRLERRLDSVRGVGLKVNPGVAALVAILATPLLIGAIAGVTILAAKSCPPERGPGSRAEAFDVLGHVWAAARKLQVAETAPAEILGLYGTPGQLGTVEGEDEATVHAAAKVPPGARIVIRKDPATGAAREVEWLFARPPAIRSHDLEERWGAPVVSPAPDEPGAVVGLFPANRAEGERWSVKVRVRFSGEVGGPVTRIAVFREP